MKELDCCFTSYNNWFRYRAAAIIVEDSCVLLVGNEKEDYLYSVGGGVHMNEKAEDAVLREVLEETGVRYEIDRLAVIHENFWKWPLMIITKSLVQPTILRRKSFRTTIKIYPCV